MTSSNEPRRTFWTPARLIQTAFIFTLVTLFAVAACTPSDPNSANPSTASNPDSKAPDGTVPGAKPNTPPAPAKPLPASVMEAEVKSIDGKSFKLGDYKGKVLLVNLWATWCGPCRSEIPDLIRVANEYGPRGVEVVGLTNEDPVADLEKVKDFVSQFKITYKIGWTDQELAMGLMQGQVRNNIPQSFIISRDGRVLKRFVGFSASETPPKLRAALEEAIKDNG